MPLGAVGLALVAERRVSHGSDPIKDVQQIHLRVLTTGNGERLLGQGRGADRAYVSLSDGFHLEEGRLPGARQVVICNECDEIDPLRTAIHSVI